MRDKSQDLVIWVDKQDNVLGEVTRGQAHKEGLLHRVSVVYLVNDNGQVLVQERTDGKFDHSCSGHVDSGEEYLQAAKRELKEELGVEGVELIEVGLASPTDENYSGEKREHIYKVYSCNSEPGELDPEEVKSVYWEYPEKIQEDMAVNEDKYTGGFKSTLKLFLQITTQS